MNDILAKIAADKKIHVADCKKHTSLTDMDARAKGASPVRGFYKNLCKARDDGRFGLIAEIKKASPSKGLIRDFFNPPLIARDYTHGGASCLSVLTDMPYFQGKDSYLKAARAATTLPVLRKDFMIDPYQIIEARALGADCILLILAMIDDGLAAELEMTAIEQGLDVLIEVHDDDELARAHKLKSPMIGINNRNLKTFDVTLDTTFALAAKMDKDRFGVSESGILTPEDLTTIREKTGIVSFLVGEALMREDDVTTATQTLLGEL